MSHSDQKKTNDIITILLQNFKNLIKDEKEFIGANRYLWEFSDHVNDNIYRIKLPDFRPDEIIETFIKTVGFLYSKFNIERVLENLIMAINGTGINKDLRFKLEFQKNDEEFVVRVKLSR